MVEFAILLTIYSQTTDNRIETDMSLYANTKICLQQGAEIVERKSSGKSKDGKPIRSVWYTCETVRGKATRVRRARG